MSTSGTLLELRGVGVAYASAAGEVAALECIDLSVRAGECLGVVGESGAGKSQLCLVAAGLCPDGARLRGTLLLDGRDCLRAGEHDWRRLRGRTVASVFQDPMNSLTPHLRIGTQLAEALAIDGSVPADVELRCLAALAKVGLDDPARRLRQYPHELSGGMRQRVSIAMALLPGPRVLIADEPTTALDVRVQAQVLGALRAACAEGVAVLCVSHDLGVLAALADRIAVIYAGRIVECAETATLLTAPRHPYTRALLEAVPRLDAPLGQPLRTIAGLPPPAHARPRGCAFEPRCELRLGRCAVERPQWLGAPGGSGIACHRQTEVQRS